MRSINEKDQKELDHRIREQLEDYLKRLDHSAIEISRDPKKARRLQKTLKKKGQVKLVKEMELVRTKRESHKVFTKKKRGNGEEDVSESSSELNVERSPENVFEVAVEAVQGLNDMVSSRFLYEGAERARTVGRISAIEGPNPIGTGFMVSPNLLMTNHHVLKSTKEAQGCYVEFDYYYSKDSLRVKSENFALRPDGFYYSNKNYDYAIVMVEATSDQGVFLSEYGWNVLSGQSYSIEPSDRLNVIHHPKGLHQQISIRKNFVVNIPNEDIYIDYMTDTDYGSSGSPVFDDEWNLVALHRSHTTIKDTKLKDNFLASLKLISKDLEAEVREGRITVNNGIKINAILEDLKEASSTMNNDERELIDQLFKTSISESLDVVSSGNELNDSGSSLSGDSENKVNNLAGQINIHGGNVTINLAQNLAPTTKVGNQGTKPSSAENVTSLELYKKSLTVQDSIFKALDYVQKSRELPYLPLDHLMNIRRENYYGDILAAFATISKSELYDSLSEKMVSTLRIVDKFPEAIDLDSAITMEASTPGSYHKARAHLYTRVDLQPEGYLKGIYTGAVIAPEQLFLNDLINSLNDEDYEMPKRYKDDNYLNCEHIVPKVYFDRLEEGFSDLHHLITADGTVNKFRNKNTFANLGGQGDDGSDRLPVYVPSGGWKSRKHFEPKRGKGLVARATLYFIVAHPKFLSKEVYSPEQIATLIQWSTDEPVTPYEQHRNETIYEVQGNRNPFIDFPAWVNQVDFERGMS